MAGEKPASLKERSGSASSASCQTAAAAELPAVTLPSAAIVFGPMPRDGVVMAGERILFSKLLVVGVPTRIFTPDRHLGIAGE